MKTAKQKVRALIRKEKGTRIRLYEVEGHGQVIVVCDDAIAADFMRDALRDQFGEEQVVEKP